MEVLARQVDALDVAGPAFECDGKAARLRPLDDAFGVDKPLLGERSESRAVERRREGPERHVRNALHRRSASFAEHLVDPVRTQVQRRGEVLAGYGQVRMSRHRQQPWDEQADRQDSA